MADAGSGAAAGGRRGAQRGGARQVAVVRRLARAAAQPPVLDLGRPDRAVRGDGHRAAAVHLDRPDLRRPGRRPAEAGQQRHLFGYDSQGYDVYARTVYGARASILVGLCATLFTFVVGRLIGLVAGFYGGWVDAVLQRLGEIFFAFPLLLGGLVFLYTFPDSPVTPFFLTVGKIILHPGLLGWPQHRPDHAVERAAGQAAATTSRRPGRSAPAPPGSSSSTSCPTPSPR